ncbi:MAG: hypothetical protein AAFR55_04805 [Pseudomonadota bacterium]
MTRTSYSAWVFGVAAVVGGTVWLSFRYLAEIAALTSPLGLNATVAQNTLIIAVTALGYLILSGASAQRARAIGAWPFTVGVGLIPVIAIGLFNGPLFFVDYLPMPPFVETAILYGFGALTIFGIGRCLMGR